MGQVWRPALRAVIMIALGACVALAAAHNSHRGIADQDAWAMDETTGSSPRDKHAPAELALSDEQRGRIDPASRLVVAMIPRYRLLP